MTIKVAFILGCGYSGSTLLDLILGSHSDMVGLGEIHAKAFDAFLSQNQMCTCLFRARECHFWKKVSERLRESTGEDPFRLAPVNGGPDSIVRNTVELYRAVKEVSSAGILVDSSKRSRRARLLSESGMIEPKVIHLVRDGRGVAYSYLKRGHTFGQAVSQWKETNDSISEWLGRGGAPEHVRVRYEDLCARPAEIVRRVCDLLGVGWEPGMMSFGQRTHHNVRGNPMRFTIDDSAIKLDEAWKAQLGADDLDLFEAVAGSTSRRLGYDHEVRKGAPLSHAPEAGQ